MRDENNDLIFILNTSRQSLIPTKFKMKSAYFVYISLSLLKKKSNFHETINFALYYAGLCHIITNGDIVLIKTCLLAIHNPAAELYKFDSSDQYIRRNAT